VESQTHQDEFATKNAVAQACLYVSQSSIDNADIILVDAKTTTFGWTLEKLAEFQEQFKSEGNVLNTKCSTLFKH
jgi:hypothetical protein